MRTMQELIERRDADMKAIAMRITSEIYSRNWQSYMNDGIEELNRTLDHKLAMTTRQDATLKVKIRFDFNDSTHMEMKRGSDSSNVSTDSLIEAAYDGGCWADSVSESPINISIISEVISVEFSDVE